MLAYPRRTNSQMEFLSLLWQQWSVSKNPTRRYRASAAVLSRPVSSLLVGQRYIITVQGDAADGQGRGGAQSIKPRIPGTSHRDGFCSGIDQRGEIG